MGPRFSDVAFGCISHICREMFSGARAVRPTFSRFHAHSVFAEPLEARVMLSQTVDAGGLRFLANSFATVQGGYQATGGQVLVGFTPSSLNEDFRAG